MLFNPLFINTQNGTLGDFEIPSKLLNSTFIFSDIIKVSIEQPQPQDPSKDSEQEPFFQFSEDELNKIFKDLTGKELQLASTKENIIQFNINDPFPSEELINTGDTQKNSVKQDSKEISKPKEEIGTNDSTEMQSQNLIVPITILPEDTNQSVPALIENIITAKDQTLDLVIPKPLEHGEIVPSNDKLVVNLNDINGSNKDEFKKYVDPVSLNDVIKQGESYIEPLKENVEQKSDLILKADPTFVMDAAPKIDATAPLISTDSIQKTEPIFATDLIQKSKPTIASDSIQKDPIIADNLTVETDPKIVGDSIQDSTSAIKVDSLQKSESVIINNNITAVPEKHNESEFKEIEISAPQEQKSPELFTQPDFISNITSGKISEANNEKDVQYTSEKAAVPQEIRILNKNIPDLRIIIPAVKKDNTNNSVNNTIIKTAASDTKAPIEKDSQAAINNNFAGSYSKSEKEITVDQSKPFKNISKEIRDFSSEKEAISRLISRTDKDLQYTKDFSIQDKNLLSKNSAPKAEQVINYRVDPSIPKDLSNKNSSPKISVTSPVNEDFSTEGIHLDDNGNDKKEQNFINSSDEKEKTVSDILQKDKLKSIGQNLSCENIDSVKDEFEKEQPSTVKQPGKIEEPLSIKSLNNKELLDYFTSKLVSIKTAANEGHNMVKQAVFNKQNDTPEKNIIKTEHPLDKKEKTIDSSLEIPKPQKETSSNDNLLADDGKKDQNSSNKELLSTEHQVQKSPDEHEIIIPAKSEAKPLNEVKTEDNIHLPKDQALPENSNHHIIANDQLSKIKMPNESNLNLNLKIKEIRFEDTVKEINKIIADTVQSHKVTLNVVPEELGSVKIELDVKNNQISARIEVESEKVRSVVQNNSEMLKNALNSCGLSLDSLNILLTGDQAKQQKQIFQKKTKTKTLTVDDKNEDTKLKRRIHSYSTYEFLA